MQLSALLEVQQTAQALKAQRSDKAERAYQSGMHLLQQSYAASFEVKQELVQACEHFLQAIQQARGFLPPYLAMAYVFTILGDARAALDYLLEARALHPHNADVQRFLAYLSQARAPAAQEHAESLRAELEHRLGQRPSLPEPSVSPQALQQQQSQLRQLSDSCQALEAQLKRLPQDEEQLALWQALNRLQTYCREFAQRVEVSQGMLGFCERMAALRAQALRLQRLGSGEREARLEALLDACDQGADELDRLIASGYEVVLLLQAYRFFKAELEEALEA